MSAFAEYIWKNRSGKSVVKAALTFVIASIVIGTLTGTGFNLGSFSGTATTEVAAAEGAATAAASAGATSAAAASSFSTFNVLNFGTINFLPIPYWGGDGGGGDGGGPSVGTASDGKTPTVPYDPYTGEVLQDYTNPATGETLTKGTIIPKSMLPVMKVYQRAILSDPQLPELNTQTTPDGFYNQKPPAGATGSALPQSPATSDTTQPATSSSSSGTMTH